MEKSSRSRSTSVLVLMLALFLFSYYFFIADVGLRYGAKSVDGGSIEKNKEENNSNCTRKYVLLTTQRSGSTWLCGLLHQQDGVSCGRKSIHGAFQRQSELLMSYSYKTRDGSIANVTWETYTNGLDRAFKDVCSDYPAQSTGFKLMYNQIPPQFIENGLLEKYWKENNVAIIHLVREAVILKIASNIQSIKQGAMHTRDPDQANKFREQAKKITWTGDTVNNVLKMENTNKIWRNRIHFMVSVRSFDLNYEDLIIDHKKEDRLKQMIAFLNLNNIRGDNTALKTVGDGLLRQHEYKCSDRILNYSSFRAHPKLQKTTTIAACDMLEKLE